MSIYKNKENIETILQAIIKISHVTSIIITDRIRIAFRTRVYRLLKDIENSTKKGSKNLYLLIKKWESNKESCSYQMKIYNEELGTASLQSEVNELKNEIESITNRKRKLKDELKESESKRLKLQNSLDTQKNITKKYKNKLSNVVRKYLNKKKSRGPSIVKTFSDYSERQQKRIFQNFSSDTKAVLSFFEGYDFLPTKLEIYNCDTGKYENISLVEDNTNSKKKVLDKKDIADVKTILYIKDKFGISNNAYHELSMNCKEMPRLWRIKELVKEMNKQWNISVTPGGKGVEQSVRRKLLERVEHLAKNTDISKSNPLRIKITGDGTNIGKHLHVVNIAFTLLNEGDKACSVDGNHPIAVLKVKEDYADLSCELSNIITEVESMTFVEYKGVRCDIVWYLGGDWKFLAMASGIGSATSEYACIWCKCPKAERHDIKKSWEARLGNETEKLAAKKGKAADKFSSKHKPLFPSIPIKNTVIDTLHLFLRITDNLQNLLILELRRQDAIDKKVTFADFDRKKFPHMANFEKFINDKCGIHFQWYVDKETKKLKWKDFTGPEKLIIFSKVCIEDLLPKFPRAKNIQALWDSFIEIYDKLRMKTITGELIDTIETMSKAWIASFCSLYQTKSVTPYMHALFSHVPELLRQHGSLVFFNQQGLEKLNQHQTKDYFRSTNFKDMEALLMLLQKNNRIAEFEDTGCKREKSTYNCGNCKEVGHNLKSCTQQCSTCGFLPYCSPQHITKINGKWLAVCM